MVGQPLILERVSDCCSLCGREERETADQPLGRVFGSTPVSELTSSSTASPKSAEVCMILQIGRFRLPLQNIAAAFKSISSTNLPSFNELGASSGPPKRARGYNLTTPALRSRASRNVQRRL